MGGRESTVQVLGVSQDVDCRGICERACNPTDPVRSLEVTDVLWLGRLGQQYAQIRSCVAGDSLT